MQDLTLTLKSCVRITKDKGASKKHPKNQNPPKPMKQTNKQTLPKKKKKQEKKNPTTQKVSSETVSRFKHYLSKRKSCEQWTIRVWFPTNTSLVFPWSHWSYRYLSFPLGGYITIFSVLCDMPWSFILNTLNTLALLPSQILSLPM